MRFFWLFVLLGCVSVVSTVAAQDIVAPRVKSLPGIDVPEDVDIPESGVVQVLVRINPDGKALVERCDAGRALCDLVAEAIERAEFVPATRDGSPVPSQVRVDLRVRRPEADEPSDETTLEPERAQVERELVFSETAEVDARGQVPIQLELEAIRNIPGTFGEPFRILEVLPGTVPVANGQPYVYLRGAPPSGTSYLYDDIPIPLLFHSALGPSTIHPGLIGGLDVFSGGAPARFGGSIGGVVSARPRRIPTDRVHGEAQARLIDVSGLLNVPMPKDGSMTFAGKYGFPNLLLGAIGVDSIVNYWDYQYRTGVDMSKRSRFEVVAFGGRDDSVFDANDPRERLSLDLQFHRFEARFLGKVKRWDFIGTMLYGYDFSDVQDASGNAVADAAADIHRFGPRFWAIYGAPKVKLRIGGDLAGLFGPVDCVEPTLSPGGPNAQIPNVPTPCDEEFAAQDRRIFAGAFIDVMASPVEWLDLSVGLRADLWDTAGQRDAGVGPRARATFHAKDFADVFVGWGIGVRPATYAIPLPGLGDVPLEPGLQRANQTEGGIRFFLPYKLTFEARGYVNLFKDLRFVDIFTNPEINANVGPPNTIIPQPVGLLDDSADGTSYGLEVLFQRGFSEHGFSTLASYTLGFSNLDVTAVANGATQTLDYTPSYDVRHVINGVLGWRAKFGLGISARVHARSGRAEGWLYVDTDGTVRQYVQRVPWFTRLDARITYEWAKPGRRLSVGLEWVNITQARDAQEIDSVNPNASEECAARWGVPEEPCPVRFTGAIWFPNLFFRALF